ncbi:MAG: serine/threonine protein kinase [Clostridia bacterium]|nr:serine/threonine protein kinase [Clostridia bacterium]
MKEKPVEKGFCPFCGYKNEDYVQVNNQLPPLTPLNGKYLLGRALGAGGFGITYIALDTHLQVVVAIKELFLKKISVRENGTTISVNPKDKACFADNKKRFLQEARVLAMFNEKDNEGVVLVKDHFEENDTAYIVMEYLNGENLKNKVKNGKLSFEQAKKLMEPVCHALTKIHQFGVVHLDVSPDNIMILENNRAKLLDFGGAKIIGAQDDVVAFKRGYAPIEQRIENGKVGQWTDVYATAATMYFCLTGKKPVDAMERRAGAELERPSKLGVKMPPKAEMALMRALELEPERRFRTMDEFWNAINCKQPKSKAKIVIILASILGGLAILSFVLLLVLGGIFGAISELDPDKDATEDVIIEAPKEGEPKELTPGTYVFESINNTDLVLSVDSGFGDNGTVVVLSDKNALSLTNHTKFFVTHGEDEDEENYFIRAAHTNSIIQSKDSKELGANLKQHTQMADNGTQKWFFVYCGHDKEANLDKFIIRNEAGSVLAPKDGKLEAGTQLVLAEYDIDDDTQKWYLRWSSKNKDESNVIVYNEGSSVRDLNGVYNITSGKGNKTSISVCRDEAYYTEPTLVTFYAEWITANDVSFQYEFVPTEKNDGTYKIYPKDQLEGERKCLEYNPETNQVVVREDTNNNNQIFKVEYVAYNVCTIKTADGLAICYDTGDNGSAEGRPVTAKAYASIKESGVGGWFINLQK